MFAFVTCPKFNSMKQPFHYRHMVDPCDSDWSCASLVCSSSGSGIAVERHIEFGIAIGGLGQMPSE
jgi:hypothetical protein